MYEYDLSTEMSKAHSPAPSGSPRGWTIQRLCSFSDAGMEHDDVISSCLPHPAASTGWLGHTSRNKALVLHVQLDEVRNDLVTSQGRACRLP